MAIREDTSKTLTVLSFVLLFLGLLVGSPAGRLLLVVLAIPPAVPPALLAPRKGIRILAVVSLVAAAAAAFATCAASRGQMDAYRSHAKGVAPAPPAATAR